VVFSWNACYHKPDINLAAARESVEKKKEREGAFVKKKEW